MTKLEQAITYFEDAIREEIWKNVVTVIMTRQLQEELVVEKQKESEGE